MKNRFRHAIALTLVTSALCADRMVCAAPQWSAPVAQLALRIAHRFGAGLGQDVPAARLVFRSAMAPLTSPRRRAMDHQPQFALPANLGPYELRLPPPAL